MTTPTPEDETQLRPEYPANVPDYGMTPMPEGAPMAGAGVAVAQRPRWMMPVTVALILVAILLAIMLVLTITEVAPWAKTAAASSATPTASAAPTSVAPTTQEVKPQTELEKLMALPTAGEVGRTSPDGPDGFIFQSPAKRMACAEMNAEQYFGRWDTSKYMPGMYCYTDFGGIDPRPEDSIDCGESNGHHKGSIATAQDGRHQYGNCDGDGGPVLTQQQMPDDPIYRINAPILPYGKKVELEHYVCGMHESQGVTCVNKKTGKGFNYSSKGYRFF